MRSMIMGEYERLTTPIVEKLRSPALIGASITLQPDAAKAVADGIEKLAQEIDIINAKARSNRQWLMFALGFIAIDAGLYLLARLAN